MAEYEIRLNYYDHLCKEDNGEISDSFNVYTSVGFRLSRVVRSANSLNSNLLMELTEVLAASEIVSLTDVRTLRSTEEKDKEKVRRIKADYIEFRELNLFRETLRDLKESSKESDTEILRRIDVLMTARRVTQVMSSAVLGQ